MDLKSSAVQTERVRQLNRRPMRMMEQGARYVLLWVQQDVRAEWNHAVTFAVELANQLGLPLVAVYGLCEKFPDANERMFAFLLDGLADLHASLRRRGIRLIALRLPPPEAALHLSSSAAAVVVDRGYTRICRQWREFAAERAGCTVYQVETSTIVPVETASCEYERSAASLRPKLHRHLPRFLIPVPEAHPSHSSLDLLLLQEGEAEHLQLNLDDPAAVLASLEIDRSVPRCRGFKGGAAQAQQHLQTFVTRKLAAYGNGKANDPSMQCNSFLSPYLHFGHISSLQIALAVRSAVATAAARDATQERPGSGAPVLGSGTRTLSGASASDAFLEELIVRRELARNFAWYCPERYDRWRGVPSWARETLEEHSADPRAQLFSFQQLCRGETDDPYWNAAQWEMVGSGHMHNYMRMY
eukprot:gene22912-27700_t